MTSRIGSTSSGHALVLSDLARLDAALERAARAMQAISGHAPDPYRGLYIEPTDVEVMLGRGPGEALFGTRPEGERLSPTWERLGKVFDLSEFDLDVLTIAVAPEIDLRYERIYGYLQDDVTRRRPTVELCLNLLCSSPAEKLDLRTRFVHDAPLASRGLISVVSDPHQVEPPLLGHYVRPSPLIVSYLLGGDGLEPSLTHCVELTQHPAGEALMTSATVAGLAAMVGVARARRAPAKLHFCGGAEESRRSAAAALAEHLGRPLLIFDARRALDRDREFEWTPALLGQQAQVSGAVLYLAGVEAVCDDAGAGRRLLSAIEHRDAVVVMSTTDGHGRALARNALRVPFRAARTAERRSTWVRSLAAAGIALDAEELDALAARFRLSPSRIEAAVGAARDHALAGETPVTVADLYAAARSESREELSESTARTAAHYTWPDIVLPPDRLAQLREICDAVRFRSVVYEQWGFERKVSVGKGVNALFAGPPGTGKTMAAEVIATDLGLDLHRVDLSLVVSKYIGETEKNLERAFAEAATTNAILFFDEADALFGRRSEVRDSHDRYANIEVGYLLQRIEAHEGVTILATNVRRNLDEAFVRRMHYTVEFPFPGVTERRQIWERLWPPDAPCEPGLDLGQVAERVELAGGSIRNIALATAFRAAADGGVITREHLAAATRRELQKVGKIVGLTDVGRLT